jgi:hypothetical protein
MKARAALFREAGDFRGSDVARRARRCQPKSGFSSFFFGRLGGFGEGYGRGIDAVL